MATVVITIIDDDEYVFGMGYGGRRGQLVSWFD